MLHPVDYLFLFNCAYLPPLTLVYLVEIWAIVKPRSPFRSTFYLLFLTGAIVDLISVGVSFHELRLPFFPLVNGFCEDYACQVCSQIRLAMTYVCPCTQDLLNCFIALNRSGRSVIIVILYAKAGRSLRKLSIGSGKRVKERNLLKFGIINFAIMLPPMLAQLAFEFFPSEWLVVVLYQFWWIIDVKSFGPAVTMIIVNTSFRKHIMKSCKLRSNVVESMSSDHPPHRSDKIIQY
ncbi:srg-39 [Pristionchus pacificus]|uniref:G protein-coupled receptor n=1 Tax=Pristionchus pacificus TaxID=54126 RepID=A0A2A6B2P8_PRIPA|nr:srg-39 [Pristionchus pacificus]|eukprot:PDM60148.1 G protein-coupled receptor [Pristionchus pacificus]